MADLLETEVNQLLLRLYREAKGRPADQFKGWAIAQLQDLVGFDSAFWFEGYPGTRVQTHTEFLFNMPEEMMVNYFAEGIAEEDFLLQATLAQPGTTINTRDLMPREELVRLRAYQEHCRHFGMEHAMSTTLVDDRLGLHTFFSVFQSDPERPFGERERRIKEIASPHMVEAFRTSLFFHLSRLDLDEGAASQGLALVDQGGVVYQATDRFTDLLVRLWPEWEGPRLPDELLRELPVSGRIRLRGLLFVTQLAGSDLLMLRAREPDRLDRLSPSERRVAAAVASGLSYKETGAQLGLSPSTVTNHLNRVYRKLGIANKVELAEQFAGHTPMLEEKPT